MVKVDMKRISIVFIHALLIINGQAFASDQKLVNGAGTLRPDR